MDLLWRLRRYIRSRRPLRPRPGRGERAHAAPLGARWRRPRPWQVTLLVGLLLAAAVIGFLEARLRPLAAAAAQAQVQNAMTGVVERAVWRQLEEEGVSYSALVDIQRDSSGAVTALTAETAAMNRLRAELVGVVLEALEGTGVSRVRIPLGSLLGLDLTWGLGPEINVHALAVGTVEGEFVSTFSSAGVNQTLHKIDLELVIPLKLMLPGGAAETACTTRVPIAETVIVGQVPQVVLQSGGS